MILTKMGMNIVMKTLVSPTDQMSAKSIKLKGGVLKLNPTFSILNLRKSVSHGAA